MHSNFFQTSQGIKQRAMQQVCAWHLATAISPHSKRIYMIPNRTTFDSISKSGPRATIPSKKNLSEELHLHQSIMTQPLGRHRMPNSKRLYLPHCASFQVSHASCANLLTCTHVQLAPSSYWDQQALILYDARASVSIQCGLITLTGRLLTRFNAYPLQVAQRKGHCMCGPEKQTQ